MTTSIFLRLVLPLLVLTALSVALQHRLDLDGLLLNLASEFIGIVITVGYVDWILREHDRRSWQGAAKRIDYRLRTLAHSAITGIRSELGFGPEYFGDLVERRNDLNAISREVRRVALEVVSPEVRHRLDDLDQAGWKRLAKSLDDISRHAEQLVANFGPRLGPRDLELLLDLQQNADGAQTFWRTFPDIAGVEDSKLPPTAGNTAELKNCFNELTAANLREVLRLAAEVLNDCCRRAAA